MEVSYKEYKPSPDLAPYVECYWLHSFKGGEQEESPVQKCVPIGMLEILVHLDDNVANIWQNESWEKLPREFFTGIYNNPVLWKMPGRGRLFGIRLKPEMFSHLFDVPAASLFCNYEDLETFFGSGIMALPQSLYNRENISAVIAQAEVFLSNRLTAMEHRHNYIVDAAHMIRNAKGNITIEEVSSTLSVSIRQLQRGFKGSMGTTPKSYLRIIRFRNAFTCLHDVHEGADIAYDLGYADQAHFIREFREFAGEAPNGVIKNAQQYHKKPAELTGAE